MEQGTNGPPRYLVLGEHVSLRRLEEPCLYDRRADELYELNDDAWEFMGRVDGATPGLERAADPEFLAYLVDEGLARLLEEPSPRRARQGAQSSPSLRYLELYLTERCNLACGHCFLGDLGRTDLPAKAALRLFDEFDAMGGLRLLLTGGEALLHPDFWHLDGTLVDRGFRTVLLTNGTLLEDVARRLHVHEVQVSLDGMEAAHDALRGEGVFRQAARGLRVAAAAGIDVSVATTVNALNRDDFEVLGAFVRELGARAWHIDAPSVCGSLAVRSELALEPWEAAPYLDLAFGGGVHDAVPGAVCGSHLMAVFPTGLAAKCGFYGDRPGGRVEEGLEELWRRVPRAPAATLTCACDFIGVCHGGCRFRASTYNGEAGPDPVQCYRYGALIRPTTEEV